MIKDLDTERNLLIRDYSRNWEFTKTALSTLGLDELIEPENIIRALLYSSQSENVSTRGYRILSRTSLSQDSLNSLISHFKNLQNLLNAKSDEIKTILGEKDSNKFNKEVSSIREQALLGKKI